MESAQKLSGGKALVTGSDTGIGREIALEFARQGADVVLHYSHHREGAVSASEEIKAMGRRTAVFSADFNDLKQAIKLANDAIKTMGSINCLVNNAGITFNRPLLKMRPQHFDKLFNVNFRAQYFITQRIVEDMLQHGGGTICNLSSIHGFRARRSTPPMRPPRARLLPIPGLSGWSWRIVASASMRSPRDGSRWKTISSRFRDSMKRMRGNPQKMRFRQRVTVCQST